MRRIRQHLTYANVMATLAVFLVVSGGTAVALSGSNTVFTDDIVDNQVLSPDVRDDTLSSGGLAAVDLRPDSVRGSEVLNGSLTGSDISEAGLDATALATRVAQGGCSPSVAGTGTMVKAGSVCIDKYEASVWSSPTGGTQYGVNGVDDYPCNNNGQDCDNIYARSVPGVEPSGEITWFQAQQALANSGKRLPTNAEWQMAVAGTPDPGTDNGTSDCNVTLQGFPNGPDPVNTGSRSACVSNWGANDMVGNQWEWVADWDEQAEGGACTNWPASYGTDLSCIGRGSGEASNGLPGAIIRGGSFDSSASAGPFAVNAFVPPSNIGSIGLRGAR